MEETIVVVRFADSQHTAEESHHLVHMDVFQLYFNSRRRVRLVTAQAIGPSRNLLRHERCRAAESVAGGCYDDGVFTTSAVHILVPHPHVIHHQQILLSEHSPSLLEALF